MTGRSAHPPVSPLTRTNIPKVQKPSAHKKSHDMSLRRHAMTSILKRDNPCPALPAWALLVIVN